jgi:uncharacterized C2H2 Zn-finger protein
MMQIAAKLAQQFAPQIINGASNLISSNSSSSKESSISGHPSENFRCPNCNKIGNFGDVSHYTHLLCDCGFEFPCKSGGTRCTCRSLLFPASMNQEIVRCDRCAKSWKTKTDYKNFGQCRCGNSFEIRSAEKMNTTDCCKTPLGQLTPVVYKAQEPRVLSEAERNR